MQEEIFTTKHSLFVNESELWTAKQRQSHSIHEISYRACFKAELPKYFIEKYSSANDIIYDPFSGRGTTGIEALLSGRIPIFNDINPLSKILSEPRTFILDIASIETRIKNILSNQYNFIEDIDLTMFFERQTLIEILKIRTYLISKEKLDIVDKWIRLLMLSRLTGHSNGFLSLYTLPPNQSVTPERQMKINQRYNTSPSYRSVLECCLKKYKSLIRNFNKNDIESLNFLSKECIFLSEDASNTPQIKNNCVDLIITSPPFLDIVNYKQDNWMRCWFCNIDVNKIHITQLKNVEDWSIKMKSVLGELKRVLKPRSHLIFEVGEVKNGTIKLEKEMEKIAKSIDFNITDILINKQQFTKTSNIWGVKNNKIGTNSNRIIVLQK